MKRQFRFKRNLPLILALAVHWVGCAAGVKDDGYPDPCKWSVACATDMAPGATAGTTDTDQPAITAAGGMGGEGATGGTGDASGPETPTAETGDGTGGEDGAGTGAADPSGGTGAGGAVPGADAGSTPTPDLPDAGASPDAGPPPPPPAIDAAADSAPAEPELPPLPDYTLVIDTPDDGDSVRGQVTVRGRATAFLNVEVWDATHQHPPLAQVVPDADDGSFELTVDTSALPTGQTTWTVHAWDSPPGASFDHTDSTTLDLQITR